MGLLNMGSFIHFISHPGLFYVILSVAKNKQIEMLMKEIDKWTDVINKQINELINLQINR